VSTARIFALLHGENSLCGSAQLVRVILSFASLENRMVVTVLDYGMASIEPIYVCKVVETHSHFLTLPPPPKAIIFEVPLMRSGLPLNIETIYVNIQVSL
jgi:hypothetical protein